jgi:hypothetical protein
MVGIATNARLSENCAFVLRYGVFGTAELICEDRKMHSSAQPS